MAIPLRCTALAVTFLTSAAVSGLSSQPAPVPGLTVADCTVPGVEGPARCGTLQVWENRVTKSGRKIPIRFVVLPATGRATRDPVVPLAGGPGQAAVEIAAFYVQEMAALRDTRDLLIVDQRGTGGSNFLSCRLFDPENLQSYLGDFYPADRVAACAAELGGKADVGAYISDAWADDLDEVRAALGYERLNLWGGSYGTRAALVYMRRYPERVRSAILHGTVPTGVRMPIHVARDAQRAVEGIFAECRAEAACNAAFPDLGASLRAVVERLSRGPVEVEIMHPETGAPARVRLSRDLFGEAVRYLTYSVGNASLVPAMVHQAARGDFGPITEFALYARRNIVDDGSHALYLTITCAEDLPFFELEEGRRLAEGTYLGDYRVRNQKAACAAWRVPPVSRDFLAPVASDAPVLLLSGEWDPVTPPAWAEVAMRTLRNARHVVVPSGAHGLGGLVGSRECIEKLTTGFIRAADPRGLDDACVARIRRGPFPTGLLGGTPITLAADQVARFAGRYRGGDGFTVEMEVREGRLNMVLPNGRAFPLVPVGPARFRSLGNPFSFTTFEEEGGQVRRAIIIEGDRFVMERVQ